MRTFVCIVPVTRCWVTTDNRESLQRRERLSAGRSIRLFQRTQAEQTYGTGDLQDVMRGQFLHMRLSPTPIRSFLCCDVMYTISAILSYGGQRSRVNIARAEGLGTRLGVYVC